jgi:large subunit ribosomal protein L15
MTTTLNELTNASRPYKRAKRVGRGSGSGLGKTCGRGEKGAGSRSGYKRRLGYEGGQFRTFMKLPIRGFSNARFRKAYHTVNLGQIEAVFEDGEVVNAHTLAERGFLSGTTYGIKILGDGELHKKVTIEVAALSDSAREKLQKAQIPFTLV